MKKTLLLSFVCVLFVIGCHKDLKNTTLNLSDKSDASSDLMSLLKKQQLNIIFIVGDDVGYEIPTYNGGQSYSTPNLDYMAANGIQFPNFFSHPDGGPSRLAALTGKYSFRNYTQWGYLPPASITFGNMLQNAGYSTAYVGKWQLDGGDTSILRGGFSKYLVYLPFEPHNPGDHDQYYRRYKDPLLYQNGNYLPAAATFNKYSEDMFYDYASKFIDSNAKKPFLLFYSFNLVQKPWTPTPDDPDYAAWNPSTDDQNKADMKYFPGMVNYMDKNIGKLIKKVKDAGLLDKTVFIFTSDNATNLQIYSMYNGKRVKGGKTLTIRRGINVPLVVYGASNIVKGVKDTSLVDMTDYMPTLASLANIPRPTTYGTLDGKTFYDNITGVSNGPQRTYVFCHWLNVFPNNGQPPLTRYAFDYNYKLYDSVNNSRFYNIRLDSAEKHPLKVLTPEEVNEKIKLQNVMNKMYQ